MRRRSMAHIKRSNPGIDEGNIAIQSLALFDSHSCILWRVPPAHRHGQLRPPGAAAFPVTLSQSLNARTASSFARAEATYVK